MGQRPTNGKLVGVHIVLALGLNPSSSGSFAAGRVRSVCLGTYFEESTVNSLEPKIGESFAYASPQM